MADHAVSVNLISPLLFDDDMSLAAAGENIDELSRPWIMIFTNKLIKECFFCLIITKTQFLLIDSYYKWITLMQE